MRLKRTVIVTTLLLSSLVSAKTVTLQNGLNGYKGCEDVSIMQDAKDQDYSWFYGRKVNHKDRKGHPTDKQLVINDFCC